jgi:hypothetical protein
MCFTGEPFDGGLAFCGVGERITMGCHLLFPPFIVQFMPLNSDQ